jgi:hypothetical protein
MFQDLNDIIFILKENSSIKNKTTATKKIIIKKKCVKKTRKQQPIYIPYNI